MTFAYWKRKTKDPAFRKLQSEYDKKLKESGFVDIESRTNSLTNYDGTYHNQAQIKNQMSGRERRTKREVSVLPSETAIRGRDHHSEWISRARETQRYYELLRQRAAEIEDDPRSFPRWLRKAFREYAEGASKSALIRKHTKLLKDFIKRRKEEALK